MSSIEWREMRESDLDDVVRLTKEVHGTHLFEPREIFAERLFLFPRGAFILERKTDGKAIGYGMVHPIISGKPPKLRTMLGSVPTPGVDENVVLYIYDIALGEEARGQGHLRKLVNMLPCQDIPWELISVNGTNKTVWPRFGFVDCAEWPFDLTVYGDKDSVSYMRRLPPVEKKEK